MEHIELSRNHKRVLSGTIYSQNRYLAVIGQVKAMIGKLSIKYDLHKEQFEIQQLIEAKKAVMWEMLHETESRHLKKYGAFPKEIAGEFDADIRNLLVLVEKL